MVEAGKQIQNYEFSIIWLSEANKSHVYVIPLHVTCPMEQEERTQVKGQKEKFSIKQAY